ncbi:MAG: long-chain fatty acid--CoA ligase [Bacteroidales bacterium]
MEPTRTFDLLERYQNLFSDKTDVLAGKENGKWVTYSVKDYIDNCNRVSYALLSMGIGKGDRVALIANNRPEWNFVDFGISQTGAVNLPIYPTISKEEYAYILKDAEPKIIFVSDKALYEKIKPLAGEVSSSIKIFTLNQVAGAPHFSEIIELGKSKEKEFAETLKKARAEVTPNDLVTLIYTSGTTGFPKGVMLTHNNLVTNFIATAGVHPLGSEARILSFLPLSHIYERMVNYHFQYKGMSIYYAENMGTITENAKEISPQIFNAVPRLMERVYDKIISKGKDLTGLKKQIFFWAVNLALRFELNHQNGWFYYIQRLIADKLVYSKWRAALGGKLEIIVSGGAALQPRLARFFWAAKIKVLEGYGLTETSPVIAVNNLTTREVKFGTVGPIIRDVQVKIAEDGEILAKGPNIMVGYYNQPALTAEVIDNEGWFHTGDIGMIVDNKYLKITDRKKEIFKLSSGKYIAPQVIENKFKESMFIEQIMVIGENQKFASALISPNFQFLHNWASIHHVSFQDNTDLISNPQVVARYQKEVGQMNQQLGEHERIKRFRLVAEEWTPQTGELSPTLKLKRKVLSDKYPELIEDIFSVDKTNGVD